MTVGELIAYLQQDPTWADLPVFTTIEDVPDDVAEFIVIEQIPGIYEQSFLEDFE